MSQDLPLLKNKPARHLFLDRHALGEQPSGPSRGADLLDLIERLGFVQLDSINTVERAHHMILFARRQGYRPKHLKPLLERDRTLFEHWTHDASIIPSRFFPHWKLRFARDRISLAKRWQSWRRAGFEEKFAEILGQVRENGPVCSSDVGEGEVRGSGGWWDWHPSKTALEYLWRTGALSVTRRNGFQKVYDLTERVLAGPHIDPHPDPDETIDWACAAALERLGFATSGEIAAFWNTATPQDARNWCMREQAAGRLTEILVEGADGSLRKVFARPGILMRTADTPAPTSRIRILSPFDPALRDRNRAERLFGFHYRIEVFVPEAKRQYGYYVFPVLEGDRLIGRIDMKCQRDTGTLNVRRFWPETGVKLSKGRLARLEAALARMARFAGCDRIAFGTGFFSSD